MNIDFIPEIQADICNVEQNTALYKEANFEGRADAIDFIDFHLLDRIDILIQNAAYEKDLNTLKQRAEKVKRSLEDTDHQLFKQFREMIRNGTCTKASFKKTVLKYLGNSLNNIGHENTVGYDNADVFFNGLLSDQALPEAATERMPEMVFYQKTPARIIFELAQMATFKQDDVFFDIGSGLGQVAILINLISGAIAKGIEYDPAYCNYANACAQQLNLHNVEFTNADAVKGDYSSGTVFFMYTPFEGRMLQNMLSILQKEAKKRTIKVFTYGPCSPHVSQQSWLKCINGNADDHYKLYEFKSLTW